MNASLELFSMLDDYLSRRITLRDLEAWLAPRLPMCFDAPDSAIGRLAGAIELGLAELQAGLRSERSLRTALSRYRDAQQVKWFSFPNDQPDNVSSSAMSEPTEVVGLLSQIQVWNSESVGATW